jgi:hypothetical protein
MSVVVKPSAYAIAAAEALDIEFTIFVAKFASSPIAAASSLRVFKVSGDKSIKLATAAAISTVVADAEFKKYGREFQATEPLPIFSCDVSVTKPSSQIAKIGLLEDQLEAVSLLI